MFIFPEMTTRDVGLHTEQIKSNISYFAIFLLLKKMGIRNITRGNGFMFFMCH